MSVSLYRATPDYLPLLVDLMEAFYAESAYPLDRAWAATSFSNLLSEPSLGVIWIVFEGEEPAGYVVMTVRYCMEFGGLGAYIDDLFVRPTYRGRGLSRALLDAFFEECQRRQVLAVHVEVGHDNSVARSLYQSYGLKDEDRLHLVGPPAQHPGSD